MRKLTLAILFSVFPALALSAKINTADKDKLLSELEGLTPEQADAIIKYRENEGSFTTLHGLYYVEGVGKDIISSNYERLTVSDYNRDDK